MEIMMTAPWNWGLSYLQTKPCILSPHGIFNGIFQTIANISFLKGFVGTVLVVPNGNLLHTRIRCSLIIQIINTRSDHCSVLIYIYVNMNVCIYILWILDMVLCINILAPALDANQCREGA